MAKRGLKSYRKALLYANEKWDFKLNDSKGSGMTIDGVINYVRLKK